MSAQTWDDQRIEVFIGALLRTGVTLAAAVVLFGAVVYLARHGHEVPNYSVFRGETKDLTHASDIVHGALGMSGQAIIQLGLLLLIATPVARVLFAAIAFVFERDYLYCVISLIVLGILLFSLFEAGG